MEIRGFGMAPMTMLSNQKTSTTEALKGRRGGLLVPIRMHKRWTLQGGVFTTKKTTRKCHSTKRPKSS